MAIAIIAIVGIEAGWRAARGRPAGVLAERLEALVLIALLVTSAGGLGLLLGGSGPREPLHLLYAVIALGALPVADSLTRTANPRRRAVITLIGAIIMLVVVARLLQTG